MKPLTALIALSALAPALAACATTGAAGPNPYHTGTALVGTLDGKAEVPPGDPNGSGEFSAWVDPAKSRICYTLGTAGISTPTAAHIHRGAPNTAGPVVIPLVTPVHDLSDTCTAVSPALASEIIANPGNFYVNVHTKDYPKGAIRAQLKRPDID